jgi:hypothetical protein
MDNGTLGVFKFWQLNIELVASSIFMLVRILYWALQPKRANVKLHNNAHEQSNFITESARP